MRLKLFLFENNHEQKINKEMLREFLCLAPNFSRKIIKNFFKKDLNCVGGIVFSVNKVQIITIKLLYLKMR